MAGNAKGGIWTPGPCGSPSDPVKATERGLNSDEPHLSMPPLTPPGAHPLTSRFADPSKILGGVYHRGVTTKQVQCHAIKKHASLKPLHPDQTSVHGMRDPIKPLAGKRPGTAAGE